MWAPGAYLPDRGEGDAVHANIGIEKYFFAAGDRILNRIKEQRNTAILPERTGPIADVLYSAAGNSADEHWYNRGVIAYSFETGADRYVDTSLRVASAAGANGVRAANRTGFGDGRHDQGRRGHGQRGDPRGRPIAVNPNPPGPEPNVFLTQALGAASPGRRGAAGGTLQSGVGFQPDYAPRASIEALEFAAGNYGLLESALAYARDDEPPEVVMTGPTRSAEADHTTFEFVNEPSVIHYTTDGSKPTESSTLWDATGPREPGEVFHVTRTTRFRWTAKDIKGNVSKGEDIFVIAPPG